MSIQKLGIGEKTSNQGINEYGKLTAAEFNDLVAKVNEMIEALNNTVYLTQEEYEVLAASGNIQPNVEYNIFEE